VVGVVEERQTRDALGVQQRLRPRGQLIYRSRLDRASVEPDGGAVMEVGIGLPATIPGVEGEQLLEWARRADAHGFSSLGTIDRIVYPNYEPLIALAAAAAVTQTIRLTTSILIAPYRANGALVAKQAATLDHLSGGRLVLGAAVGIREDDYEASGVDVHTRGRRFDEMLAEWKRIWAGETFGTAGPIGPPARNGGPELILGGSVDAAFRRAAQYGSGWIMGGGTPDQFREGAAKAHEAWRAAGRDGKPRTLALAYFALGDGAGEAAERYLKDYYAWLGGVADLIAGSAATDADTVKGYVSAFADAGCDELILFPSSPDPGQVDLLADAVL
jgi:alkanesulfonate monooxygenase SsuD/methylene tetrahydromethanopterin reductase-like flavin-dependent oxidoreductase (luciferase family)